MPAAVLLGLYWFLLLGGLGTVFPFFSLYLTQSAGLSGAQAGAVMAMLPLIGLFAQPGWGHVADRRGSRVRALSLLSFGTAVGYALLPFAHGFPAILAATALLACFSSAVMPMAVAVTLTLLDHTGPYGFGRVRAWGTIGFLLTVAGLPILAGLAPGETQSDGTLAFVFPAAAAFTLTAAAVSLLLPPEPRGSSRAEPGAWRSLLARGPFVRVLACVMLAYLFLQGPIVFFPVYVHALGGSVETVSRLWIVMLLLEIPLVTFSGAGFRRFGGRGLLAVGIGSGALRWLVCGYASSPWLIYPVQLLHGVNVTGLIIGASLYVEAVVPERLRSTAQGALSMVGVSLGGVCSSLAAGWLIEHVGPTAPARAGGIGALVLTLVIPALIPKPEKFTRNNVAP
jgi:PPP family 3-phenylpropionic acid transporter